MISLSKSASVLTITEYPGGYAARTKYNAQYADLTVAFALNFDTPGEVCTRDAAGDKYVAIPLEPGRMMGDVFGPAEAILDAMQWIQALDEPSDDSGRVKIVNIAGNGIYTLARNSITQEDVNAYLFDILSVVHAQHTVQEVVSGGQTGIDIAGAVAACAVGVERVSLVMPRGLMQRTVDRRDVMNFEADIREQVEMGVARLLQ